MTSYLELHIPKVNKHGTTQKVFVHCANFGGQPFGKVLAGICQLDVEECTNVLAQRRLALGSGA